MRRPSATASLLLTVRSEGQRWDQQQRVGDAVRRQQQRQLVQDEPAEVAVCLLLRRGGQPGVVALLLLLHGLVSGRHAEGKQSQAFLQSHSAGLHLRQT